MWQQYLRVSVMLKLVPKAARKLEEKEKNSISGCEMGKENFSHEWQQVWMYSWTIWRAKRTERGKHSCKNDPLNPNRPVAASWQPVRLRMCVERNDKNQRWATPTTGAASFWGAWAGGRLQRELEVLLNAAGAGSCCCCRCCCRLQTSSSEFA